MSVSLGLGLAALGRPAYISLGRDRDLGPFSHRSVEAMRARTHGMLDAAWNAGVRYVDVARSYGRAEQFLGEWLALAPERRNALTIGSKWGYRYVADWQLDVDEHEVKEHSRAMLDAQWPLTVDALGGFPDLYLVHSVTPESPAFGDGALLDQLRSLASEGVRVGISTSGPQQGDVIDAALNLADTPFRAVQATVNLLETSACPALARARSAGWTVVAKEVFANGRLTSTAQDGADGRDGRAATEVRASTGRTPENVALGWALAQPFLDVALTGAVTEQQLMSNLAAPILDRVELASVVELAEPPHQYWATRSALLWR